MSKKMLKRSLALGALMVFVITGSAMAANEVHDDNVELNSFDSISKVIDYSITDEKLVSKVAVKQNKDCNTSFVGNVGETLNYSYVVKVGNKNGDGGNNSTKVLGQAAKDGGKDLTFNSNVNIYHESDSQRNYTGNASIFGIDTYMGIWTFNGITDVTVKSTDAQNTGSAISATGIRTWGLTWNAAQSEYVDGSSQIILNGDTTVYVSGVDASQGTNPNDDENPLLGKPGTVTGIGVDDNANITAKKLDVTVESLGGSATKVGATAYGVNVEAGTANFNGETKITSTSNYGNAYGVRVDGEGFTMTTGAFRGDAQVAFNDDLTINATGAFVARGVEARNGSNVSIGNDAKTNNVTINAVAKNENASDDWVIGVFSRHDDSIIDIKGDTVTINATATGTNMASGILANTTKDDLSEKATLIVDANNIVITADAAEDGNAAAITTMSGSETIIKGNLTATADKVIYTRGNAMTVINESGKDTVVLNGDIAFAKGYTDADKINATVEINLNNAESEFNGSIYTQSINGERNTFTSEFTNGAILSFSNGAKWNLTGESIVNKVTFGEGSVLNIEGSKYTEDVYALNAVGNKKSLTVEQGAKLAIEGIKENVTYNIAKDFGVDVTVGENWTIDNNLMTGEWKKATDIEDGLQVTTVAKEAGEIAKDMGVDGGTADALAGIIDAVNDTTSTPTEAQKNVQAFANAIANVSPEVAAAAAEAVVKMAEAGGNNATAASIVKNVTGVTNDRLSFNCGHSAPHKGGHGVGLFEEGSGADIWVEYVHGKDEVEDMKSSAGATSYEGSYDGIVMGVDFKKVNKFQSGIAFNYGEGDTNSVGTLARTRSDYDFWGIGYYGNIHNDDSNVIFDINYAKSDSDVTNYNVGGLTYEASPETTTWTAGVKVEKLYQNNNVQIVPYTGLRYMSIDADDYATKCGTFNYKMDRQDIWLLPVGVSIRQEVTNDNGWTVSPRVDLSYIWAFGDTDSDMEFATAYNNKVTNIGYDVMDDGSFLGLVGIEAHKGQWGYGVAYSYQKGDHSESKKWFVDVNYSF